MRFAMLMTTTALGVCLAQLPPGPGPQGQPPRTEDIKAYLTLTDSQIAQLNSIRQQQQQSVQPLHQELTQKQESLRQQIERGSTDAAALGRLLIDIENVRRRIQTTIENFRAQAKNVLTEAQKTKLKVLEDATQLREEIGQATMLQLLTPQPPEGPGGPGGPGRPGMGGMRPVRGGPGGPQF